MDPLQKLQTMLSWLIPVIVLAGLVLPQMVRILREYQRAVVFRLGKLLHAKGPGLVLLIPIVDRMVRVDHRRAQAGDDDARQCTRGCWCRRLFPRS